MWASIKGSTAQHNKKEEEVDSIHLNNRIACSDDSMDESNGTPVEVEADDDVKHMYLQ